MSDDLQKQLATALSRIAALEAAKSTPAPPAFDPQAFRRQLVADPIGTMQRALGMSPEEVLHISRVHVAHTMGDQAPEPLRMMAQMGPQVVATQQLANDLASTRQQIEQLVKREQQTQLRQSFSATSADKTKYPLLAAAMVKNPALFESDLGAHQGDAASLATSIEARLRATAEAVGYTPPASSVNADATQDPSQQVKQAQGADMQPPPIQQQKVGAFTEKEANELKERIIRKYSA